MFGEFGEQIDDPTTQKIPSAFWYNSYPHFGQARQMAVNHRELANRIFFSKRLDEF